MNGPNKVAQKRAMALLDQHCKPTRSEAERCRAELLEKYPGAMVKVTSFRVGPRGGSGREFAIRVYGVAS